MLFLALKAALIGGAVVGATELMKRSALLSAILISLPLTSIVGLVFLYQETKDLEKVSTLSSGIFWMVLPTLFFFILFPVLLRNNVKFYPALGVSALLMGLFYFGFSLLLKKFIS